MEHWGIFVAYGWLATILLAFTDAVRAIRKGPQPQLQAWERHPPEESADESGEYSSEQSSSSPSDKQPR